MKVVFLQTGTEPSYIMLSTNRKLTPRQKSIHGRHFQILLFLLCYFYKSTWYCFITNNSGHHQQVGYKIFTDPSQHCHKFPISSLGCCRHFSPYSEYSIDIEFERLAQLCLKLAFLFYCIPFVFFLYLWRTMILEIVISFLSQTGTLRNIICVSFRQRCNHTSLRVKNVAWQCVDSFNLLQQKVKL